MLQKNRDLSKQSPSPAHVFVGLRRKTPGERRVGVRLQGAQAGVRFGDDLQRVGTAPGRGVRTCNEQTIFTFVSLRDTDM